MKFWWCINKFNPLDVAQIQFIRSTVKILANASFSRIDKPNWDPVKFADGV